MCQADNSRVEKSEESWLEAWAALCFFFSLFWLKLKKLVSDFDELREHTKSMYWKNKDYFEVWVKLLQYRQKKKYAAGSECKVSLNDLPG